MSTAVIDLRNFDRDATYHNGTLNGVLYAVRGGLRQGIYLSSQTATAIKMQDPTVTIRTFIRAVDATRFLHGYERTTSERATDAHSARTLRAHVLKTGKMSKKTKKICAQMIESMVDEADEDDAPMERSYPGSLNVSALQLRAQDIASEKARWSAQKPHNQKRNIELEIQAYMAAPLDHDEEQLIDEIEATHHANSLKGTTDILKGDQNQSAIRAACGMALSDGPSSPLSSEARARRRTQVEMAMAELSSPSIVAMASPCSSSPPLSISPSSSPSTSCSSMRKTHVERSQELGPVCDDLADSDRARAMSRSTLRVEPYRRAGAIEPPITVYGPDRRRYQRATHYRPRRVEPLKWVPVTICAAEPVKGPQPVQFDFGAPHVSAQKDGRVLSVINMYYNDATSKSRDNKSPVPDDADDSACNLRLASCGELNAGQGTISDSEDGDIDGQWDGMWVSLPEAE